MKFQIKNMFAPEINEVELSEKEIAFITAIASGVTGKKASQVLNLKQKDVKNLYLKFGLTDTTKNRGIQIATIAVTNKLINKDTFLIFGDKYGFTECIEFGERI